MRGRIYRWTCFVIIFIIRKQSNLMVTVQKNKALHNGFKSYYLSFLVFGSDEVDSGYDDCDDDVYQHQEAARDTEHRKDHLACEGSADYDCTQDYILNCQGSIYSAHNCRENEAESFEDDRRH